MRWLASLMPENFQRAYLNCLVAIYKNKTFRELQENIDQFISALSPADSALGKRLTRFFLLLIPIPISRRISSFKKPPAQLVIETIPIFTFLLSRGKIDLQAGRKEIYFEMPLMRTVRDCLDLLSPCKIPSWSAQSFEENLVRFYEFLFRIYNDRRMARVIIAWIKEAATLLGLLLTGEKNYKEVTPEDLQTAFDIIRSILFRIPGIDWLVIERVSKFQRGKTLNELMRWSMSSGHEKQLKAYFYWQLGKVMQRGSLDSPNEYQGLDSILYNSFVNFLCLKRLQLETKKAVNASIDHHFIEFRRMCEQVAELTFSNALTALSETSTTSEAFNVLRVLKKRATEYTQLVSKKQPTFRSYEYSTFIGQQRPIIVLLSMLNALKKPDKKVGRAEILLGFTYWTDLVFEEAGNMETLNQNLGAFQRYSNNFTRKKKIFQHFLTVNE